MGSWHPDRLIGLGVAILSSAFITLASAAVVAPLSTQPPSPMASVHSASPTQIASGSGSSVPSPEVLPSEPLTPQSATPTPFASILPGDPTPTPPAPPPPATPFPTPTRPPPVPTLVICANGVDNSGGLGVICEVTILTTGFLSTVTVRECHGAAGDPTASCTTTVTVLSDALIEVAQCNGSANGGGATLRCSVLVSGGSGTATVNQCVGSGGGITTGCHPFPATVDNATITQCNGSANGGTLVGMTCIAAGSATVTVNQCNGSANGGGALLICSART